jgi:uncharacterized protein (TIRG00374 family)
MSSVFATVVVERIIDVFSLLVLMLVCIFIYPFPKWVTQSGYIMFAGAFGLFLLLILFKKATPVFMRLFGWILKPLPEPVGQRALATTERFLSGLVPLKQWYDYLAVGLLSFLIWACYGLTLHFTLYAFSFPSTYQLPWSAALILLVITTIAVVVPSSPGYVGTYHYLCQITLAMFGVPDSPALSFAFVLHAVNFILVMLVGLAFAHYEGVAILKMSRETTVTAEKSDI